MKNSFCSHCGTSLSYVPFIPKACLSCGEIAWDNPIPVAVCVQPIIAPYGNIGLAMAQRAIEPKLGSWAMLGGHLEQDEPFEQGAIREFEEETCGLEPGATVGITGSYTNGHGHVLVAVEFKPITLEHWEQAKLCPENSAFGVMWQHPASERTSLGFPIHQWIASAFFTSIRGQHKTWNN